MKCLQISYMKELAKLSRHMNSLNFQTTRLLDPIANNTTSISFTQDYSQNSKSFRNIPYLVKSQIPSVSSVITVSSNLLGVQLSTNYNAVLPSFIQICNFSLSGCHRSSTKNSGFNGCKPFVPPTKMRMLKKRKVSTDSEDYKVAAYASADEYDLEELLKGFQKLGLYERSNHHIAKANAALGLSQGHDLEEDSKFKEAEQQVRGFNFSSTSSHDELDCIPDITEVLHVIGQYKISSEPREIFFFRDGSLVFWNIDELERSNILTYVKQFCLGDVVSPETMDEQSESLPYSYAEDKTRLSGGRILLTEGKPSYLERYAFSNALAHSVKLGVWETELDCYIDSIKPVAEELRKKGTIILPKKEVFLRLGQLYELRHSLTLSSDLLDTPDYYWDREHLELLYRRTSNYLSISRRTEIMSDKLNNCMQLLELLKNYHGEEQSHRLERIIIYLIIIEVVFESLHFIIK